MYKHPMYEILTEGEKVLFSHLRHHKKHFLRHGHGPAKKEYKLMDSNFSSVMFINGNDLRSLVKKKYIAIEQLNMMNKMDFEYTIIFSPGHTAVKPKEPF